MFQNFNYICITNLSGRNDNLKQIERFGLIQQLLTPPILSFRPFAVEAASAGNLGGFLFSRGCLNLYPSKTSAVKFSIKTNLLETAKQNKILQCLSLTTGAAKQAMSNENAQIVFNAIELIRRGCRRKCSNRYLGGGINAIAA